MTTRNGSPSDDPAPPAPLAAIVAAVPVCDEESRLGASLDALIAATCHPDLDGLAIRVAVVLDGCTDGSAEIARAAAGVVNADRSQRRLLVIEAIGGNVGSARHQGLLAGLEDLSTSSADGIWLATTDADSTVPSCWLACQIEQRRRGVEAWAGTVTIGDWSDRPDRIRGPFRQQYELGSQQGHVHGASMGFAATAYLSAGGFPQVPTAEDHGLWRRFGAIGVRRLHDLTCPVATSGRREGRAPDGFAHAINDLEECFTTDLEDCDRAVIPTLLSET